MTALLYGAEAILKICVDRVFLLPVKFPMFLSDTIHRMTECGSPIVCPVYGGMNRHPVLVSKSVIGSLLDYNGDGGLKKALRCQGFSEQVEEVTCCGGRGDHYVGRVR